MNRWHVRYRYRAGECWVHLPDSAEAVARLCYAERKQHLSRLAGSRVELVNDGQLIDFSDGCENPQSALAQRAPDPQSEVPHGA